jgi:hypothetical protein
MVLADHQVPHKKLEMEVLVVEEIMALPQLVLAIIQVRQIKVVMVYLV